MCIFAWIMTSSLTHFARDLAEQLFVGRLERMHVYLGARVGVDVRRPRSGVRRVVEAARVGDGRDDLVVLVVGVDGAVAPHEVAVAGVVRVSGAGLAGGLDHVDPEVVPVGIHLGKGEEV